VPRGMVCGLSDRRELATKRVTAYGLIPSFLIAEKGLDPRVDPGVSISIGADEVIGCIVTAGVVLSPRAHIIVLVKLAESRRTSWIYEGDHTA
jgi:hypothetical protein